MKNQALLLILSALVFTLFYPSVSLAHTLKQDGAIHGAIHIDPDDDPIVGQQSTIIIELKDTDGKLSGNNCSCTFQISSEEKILYEQPLFQGASEANLQNIIIPFTFPRRDIYELKVKGIPANGGTFRAFSINYSIPVSREVSDKASLQKNVSFLSTYMPYIIGAGVIIIFIVAALIRKRLPQ